MYWIFQILRTDHMIRYCLSTYTKAIMVNNIHIYTCFNDSLPYSYENALVYKRPFQSVFYELICLYRHIFFFLLHLTNSYIQGLWLYSNQTNSLTFFFFLPFEYQVEKKIKRISTCIISINISLRLFFASSSSFLSCCTH